MLVQFTTPECFRVHRADLAAGRGEEYLDALAERLFSMEEIVSLCLDPGKGSVEIRHAAHRGSKSLQIWPKVEAILNDGTMPVADAPPRNGIARCRALCLAQGRPVNMKRFGDGVTTWEFRHRSPHRIRLENHVIKGNPLLCERVSKGAPGAEGILRCRAVAFTGTVTLWLDAKPDEKRLIDRLDSLLDSLPASPTENTGIEPREDHRRQISLPEKHNPPEPAGDGIPGFKNASVSLALAAAGQFALPVLVPVGAAYFLYSSLPIYKSAGKDLKTLRPGNALLNATLLTCCVASGQVFAGSFIAWCMSAGKKLLTGTQQKTGEMLTGNLLDPPRTAGVVRNGNVVETATADIVRNEVVLVEAGETVPVDGWIAEGFGMVDERTLTGNSMPQAKSLGNRVFASSLLLSGRVFVVTEKIAGETASGKIASLMAGNIPEQARQSDPHESAMAPWLLALGGLAAGTAGLAPAVAVMSSNPGPAMEMIAPVGRRAFHARCAHRGVLVEDREAFGVLGKADVVLIDHTALLNKTQMRIRRILPADNVDPHHVLRLAASAEQRFFNGIGHAVRAGAVEKRVELLPAEEFRYHVGSGVSADVLGVPVRVGNRRFMEAQNIAIPDEYAEEPVAGVLRRIYVAKAGTVCGILELDAPFRRGIREAVAAMKDGGARSVMLVSEESDPYVRRLASAIGADRYFSATPRIGGHAMHVAMLRTAGHTVCYIGTRESDRSAMREADLSISLCSLSKLRDNPPKVEPVADRHPDRHRRGGSLSPRFQHLANHFHQRGGTDGIGTVQHAPLAEDAGRKLRQEPGSGIRHGSQTGASADQAILFGRYE